MTRRIDFRFVYLAVAVLYARMRDTAYPGNAIRDLFPGDCALGKTLVGFTP